MGGGGGVPNTIVYGEATCNEMHAIHDKHHEVSTFLKVTTTHKSVIYDIL